jgi:hypothetical protein
MSPDHRLASLLAVFAAPAAERLVRHAQGVDTEPAVALARAPRRERLAALAAAADPPDRDAVDAALSRERPALRRLATLLDAGERVAIEPLRRGEAVLRRLLLEQLLR